MNRWNEESLLEVVEALAEHEGMICDEDQLSEMFDEMLEENYHYNGGRHPSEYSDTDINLMFNDWMDGMVQDGSIHPEQANHYCYEGRYEND